MNEVQIFISPMFGEVRTAGTPDNPLFCLSDVCKALGLTAKGIKQRLSEDVISNYPLMTNGGIQLFTFVNEDGLYDAIFDSRKPEAKAFRKWVTSEVLPSIRKTGNYSIQNLSRKELAQMVIEAEEEKERLQLENKQLANDLFTQQNINGMLQGENDVMRPKAKIYDDIIHTPQDNSLCTTNSLANEIGMSGQKLNKMLVANGIIYQAPDGEYIFTAEYRDWNLGKTVSTEISAKQGLIKKYIKWNARGRAYIHALHATNWDKRRAWRYIYRGNDTDA